MSIRKLFTYISISAALLGCVPQEKIEQEGNGTSGSGSSSYTGEGCSLELVIRGGDYGSDASTKADAEDIKRIENNEFERLMVMIIDDNAKLVAYRVIKKGGVSEPVDARGDIDFDNPTTGAYLRGYKPSLDTGVNNYIYDSDETPETMKYDEIHLEFVYEHPLHTATNEALSSERLTPGWYTILAIGNYLGDDFKGSGTDYGGTEKSVKNLLEDIYFEFNDSEKDGIDYFAPKKYDGSAWVQSWPPEKQQSQAGKDLIQFAYKLKRNGDIPGYSGSEPNKTDFMRSPTLDIIVSKVERFFLNPGQNNFNMELKRTTARVEFEIQNFSDRKMKIAGLEFCERFASGNTWLFPHTALPVLGWTDNDRDIFRQKSSLTGIWGIGPMDPTGPSAIIPFDSETEYQKSDGAKTFFDCLIYETRPLASETVPYWYSVGVIPETGVGTGKFYSESTPMSETTNTDTHVLDDFTVHNSGSTLKASPTTNSSVGSSSTSSSSTSTFVSSIRISSTYIPYDNVYVLKSLRNDAANRRYLYDDGAGKVDAKSFDSNFPSGIEAIWEESNYAAYFWKWDGNSLQNCGTGYYMSVPTGQNQSITTVATKSDATNLLIEKYDDNDGTGVKIRRNSDASNYINLNSGTFVGTWSLDTGCNIGLFQVSFKDAAKTTSAKVWGKELWQNPLMAIDEDSSDAMPYYVNEINRNEHLKVRIGVSYNINNQSLNFQVKSWTEKKNTFEFE